MVKFAIKYIIALTIWERSHVKHILTNLFRPFGFIAPKTLNYLAFQSLDFERT